MDANGPERARRDGEARVLWVLWLTYGSFYFCRTNISAALPGIEKELGLEKVQIGTILGALKIAYGVGQFVNGQISDLVRPRVLLGIGMMLSAALNAVFGLAEGFWFLLFVWACNGYVQAFGWSPCMRVAADWFPPGVRGRAIGIVGTGYQVTAALTFLVAGAAVEWFGWRAAFWAPSILLFLAGLHMLVFLEERPERGGPAAAPKERVPFRFDRLAAGLAQTLANPALWLLGTGLGLLNACRYGFLDWGISHLHESHRVAVGSAAVKYAVLPLGGVAGAFASGFATDRWFGGRRAPVIVGLLLALGGITLVYDRIVAMGPAMTLAVLFVVGFCIYGPQVLLVGTAPVDLARGGTAAASVGFVNFLGYMGAFAGDRSTGRMVDEHGWSAALALWAGFAFAAALCVAFLWRARAAEASA